MHKGWHIGASLAAFLAFETECWAEETSPYGVTLDSLDVGAEVAEKVGLESPLVTGAGKAAGVAGMGLDIRKANQNLGKKWQTGEKATMNDFVPYAVPLLLLTPAGETVLLAYGVYKLGSYAIDVYKRQQLASDTAVDPNQQWQQGIETQKEAIRLADMVAAKAVAERLKKAAGSSDLDKIDPNNFHSDSFSVDHDTVAPSAVESQTGWHLTGSYELQSGQMLYSAVNDDVCVPYDGFRDFVEQHLINSPEICEILATQTSDSTITRLLNCKVYTDFGIRWSKNQFEYKLNTDQKITETKITDFFSIDKRTMEIAYRNVFEACQTQPVDCSPEEKAAITAKYNSEIATAMCADP
ncbi:hypothetical protein [Rhizobium sp. LEGMi135b]